MKVEFKSKPKRTIFFERGRNSIWGFISIGVFIASLIIVLVSVNISHANNGNAGYIVGSLGLTALFSSIAGIFIGLRGFRDEDKIYSADICRLYRQCDYYGIYHIFVYNRILI